MVYEQPKYKDAIKDGAAKQMEAIKQREDAAKEAKKAAAKEAKEMAHEMKLASKELWNAQMGKKAEQDFITKNQIPGQS